MLVYPSATDLSGRRLSLLAGLLDAYRRAIGPRWRQLSAARQPLSRSQSTHDFSGSGSADIRTSAVLAQITTEVRHGERDGAAFSRINQALLHQRVTRRG